MTIRRMRPALGTFVEIVIDQKSAPVNAADLAFEAIEVIHHSLSFHQTNSYLQQLNLNPHQWIKVPPAIKRLLQLAQILTLRTEGQFDCTLGRTMVQCGALPSPTSHSSLDCVRERATGAFLAFNGSTVKLTQAVWLVMDGIAKGYAVDLAVKALKAQGIKSGWVNAGGDIRIFGESEAVFEIRHQSQNVGSVQLRNIAMASSAQEQSSDYPAVLINQANQSVSGIYSVAAPWAFLADALTKVVAACSDEKVTALLATFNAQRIYPNR
jgi:FAD:protein FMN transferase